MRALLEFRSLWSNTASAICVVLYALDWARWIRDRIRDARFE
jgi:hypothetical protein